MTTARENSANKSDAFPLNAVALMDDVTFAALADFVERNTGIKMPAEKKTMLEGRLRLRLRDLGLNDYRKYVKYLFSEFGKRQEMAYFLDLVTTNKTDFFRENQHFEYLRSDVLPDLVERFGPKLRFWSAPVSEGHEAYSLAMVLAEYALAEAPPGFCWSILGSDLSSRALAVGKRAVYPREAVEPVPTAIRPKYLLRKQTDKGMLVRITPDLCRTVTFHRMNFMDDTYKLPKEFAKPFHAVFCRNMLIYFDHETQKKVLLNLARHMAKGSVLFTGHAEPLHGLSIPFERLTNSVYLMPA